MEQKLVRFIKFHGYLFFGFALFFALREMWLLTIDALYSNNQYWNYDGDAFIRCHPNVRWMFTILWLLTLAVMYSGLKWEDREYLKPAKYLFLLEVLVVLTQDLIRTINNESNERLILDAGYLFFFSAIVGYVLYTFHILGILFDRHAVTIASSVSKIAIINCDSRMV